jgi:hypothetical protein
MGVRLSVNFDRKMFGDKNLRNGGYGSAIVATHNIQMVDSGNGNIILVGANRNKSTNIMIRWSKL